MSKVYKLAVIGKDVSKSDSAKMHTFDFRGLGSECTFDLLSVAKENFDEYAKKLIAEYDAFCVTIPYKLDIIPYLDKIVDDAETFGAVNVVKDKIGYNTDGVGFMLMLEINGIDPKGKKILVLGAGGAGRSVIKKLADAGADVYAYDLRTENLDSVYRDFGCFTPLKTLEPADYDVIINVTTARGCSSTRRTTATASCWANSRMQPRRQGCLKSTKRYIRIKPRTKWRAFAALYVRQTVQENAPRQRAPGCAG